jgi:CHAT domain-containing protein
MPTFGGIRIRTVLVEYLVLSSHVVVFGVRADWDQPRFEAVPVDRVELMLFVESNFGSGGQVRELVELGMEEVWHGYDRLIAPLRRWTEPGDVVYLVPHGLLHYLPLHALRIDDRSLIERNPVAYGPSASVLAQVLARPHVEQRVGMKSTVFGDSLGDLPYARCEAVKLGELLAVEPVLGAEVNRLAVLHGLANSDIVHIAGHGRFDGSDALSSGLYLANNDLLTAADVFRLPPVRASLVTLSGCETGVSRNQAGDELIGLTRAFLYARASALIVSLWSVGDDSTAFLMERFYAHLLGGAAGSTVHALRAAMVETMEVPSWSSFYHWAPFVLVGDWR